MGEGGGESKALKFITTYRGGSDELLQHYRKPFWDIQMIHFFYKYIVLQSLHTMQCFVDVSFVLKMKFEFI